MKRFMKGFAVLALTAVAAASAACSVTKNMRNPYEVAVELGYEGTAGSFLTESLSSGTPEHRLYEEAKADGYEGSFVEFLKEIGATSERGIQGALMSAVSVVSTFGNAGGPTFYGEGYSSLGSGVIYSIDRSAGNAYLITNYHVIYNQKSSGTETIPHISEDITVYLYGGEVSARAVEATYVGGTMQYDLAVLKIEDSQIIKESSATAALFADSDSIRVGDGVYAVGNPNAEGISAVKGIVSVDAEYIDIELADGSGTTNLLEIRTDAPINHGNSGGGLFDESGRLVGIVNARSEADGVEGFGYAIPSNLVGSIVQNIIDNSLVNSSRAALRAMLGVTVQVTDSKSVYDELAGVSYIMETITVQSVEIGKPAFGKLQVGDVIYSVQIGDADPIVVTRMHFLTDAMFRVRKGDGVTLVVSRGDKTQTVTLDFSENSDFTPVA